MHISFWRATSSIGDKWLQVSAFLAIIFFKKMKIYSIFTWAYKSTFNLLFETLPFFFFPHFKKKKIQVYFNLILATKKKKKIR